MTIAAFLLFPKFDGPVPQRKSIVLRKRYWLYYALTMMNGARRQIFTAFAGFLLVEKFGYTVPQMAMLLLVTSGSTLSSLRASARWSGIGVSGAPSPSRTWF